MKVLRSVFITLSFCVGSTVFAYDLDTSPETEPAHPPPEQRYNEGPSVIQYPNTDGPDSINEWTGGVGGPQDLQQAIPEW